MRMRDRRNYESITFSDPYRLFSVIMQHGQQLGISALSSYLTDSFCKAVVKFHQIVKDKVPGFENFMTFIGAIAYLPSPEIENREFMIQHTADKYKSSDKGYLVSTGKYGDTIFATARAKHYYPSRDFELVVFTKGVSSTYEVTTSIKLKKGMAAYITGSDPLLGNQHFAARMYRDKERKCWAFNLPPGIKQGDYQIFYGPKKNHLWLFIKINMDKR